VWATKPGVVVEGKKEPPRRMLAAAKSRVVGTPICLLSSPARACLRRLVLML
jgi:hypothetical protein